ncbi:hypothetical protein PR048_033690 [Dryococelus australis]|uniref:Uncharacterized protein n=1 Tax=Dryococelus australis TaxID=614101 RepID=A0ABQ9G114_9NEOP|nr:hypothetical protein PR048_033690 [Dryococelus australis]
MSQARERPDLYSGGLEAAGMQCRGGVMSFCPGRRGNTLVIVSASCLVVGAPPFPMSGQLAGSQRLLIRSCCPYVQTLCRWDMAKVVLKSDPHVEEIGKGRFCNVSCFKFIVRSITLILLYFSLSVGLTFYQRWFLKNFHFPLTVVVIHLVVKFLLALLYRLAWACYTKQSRVVLSWDNFISKIGPTGIASGLDVAFSNWGLELVKVSLFSKLDVSADSLRGMTDLPFSGVMGSDGKFAWQVSPEGSVATLTNGVRPRVVRKEQSTSSGADDGPVFQKQEGSAAAEVASGGIVFGCGVRWTMAQLIMQKSKLCLQNPLDMIFFVQPWMIVGVLPFAVAFEEFDGLFFLVDVVALVDPPAVAFPFGGVLFGFDSTGVRTVCDSFFRLLVPWCGPLQAILIVLWTTPTLGPQRGPKGMLSGPAAKGELVGYQEVGCRSGLRLREPLDDIDRQLHYPRVQEAVTVVLAVEWTGDQLSMVNVVGLLVCLGGILVHVKHKVARAQEEGRTGLGGMDTCDADCISLDGGVSKGSELQVPLLGEDGQGGPPSLHSGDDDSEEDSSTVLFSVLQHWDNVR